MKSPAEDDRLVDYLSAQRKKPVFSVERPTSTFPELVVTVPDSWGSIQLAPLYDVHIGAGEHDAALFQRHLTWIRRTPNVLTFNGGDMIENASKLSVGAGVYSQDFSPQNQLVEALKQLAGVSHKMLFSLPGNHEARTQIMGVDVAQWMSWMLGVPYFSDYCFCTIKWRGNCFRILAHHGTGAAQTAGAQRMAARKDVLWARPVDIYWTGHLHQPLVDVLYQTDADQKTGLLYERNGLVLISPSYLGYFGSYAAQKRYSPGTRGLAVVVLHDDGRIDAEIHARGRRL